MLNNLHFAGAAKGAGGAQAAGGGRFRRFTRTLTFNVNES